MQIASNDILSRRNEIKDFVAAGNVEKAIKRFIDFVRDFYEEAGNNIVLLSMDFSSIKKEINLGTIKPDDARFEIRKIALRVLTNLDEVMANLEDS